MTSTLQRRRNFTSKRPRTILTVFLLTLAFTGTAATASGQAVAYSPDGKTIASGFNKGKLSLWDAGSQKKIRSLDGHTKDVKAVAYSPDGKLLASGGETIRLWNAETGVAVATLDGHKEGFGVWGWLRALAFSPDGKLLASGGADGTIKLWDVAARKEIRTLGAPSDYPVRTVAFSPDGKLLASGGGETRVIALWNVATGKQLHKLFADEFSNPNAVLFTHDGKSLVSGNDNGDVVFWDVATGKNLRTLDVRGVESMALSPDGKLLASSYSRDVVIWDLGLGVKVQTMPSHGAALAFSRDGKFLLAGTHDDWKVEAVNPD